MGFCKIQQNKVAPICKVKDKMFLHKGQNHKEKGTLPTQ